MTEIDFRKIRPSFGGQREAFEEFCCYIARVTANPPKGSEPQHFRGDGGDGGVDFLWTLPDGSKWGYQAKYIFKLSKKQLTDSIKQAIKVHPQLVRYTFYFPYDFTGPTGRRGKSESEKFSEYIKEWTNLADAKGMSMDLHCIGEHELRNLLLSIDSNGNLANYWFESSTSQTIIGDHNVQVTGNVNLHINETKVVRNLVQPGPQHVSEEQSYKIKQLIDKAVELEVTAKPESDKKRLYGKWWGQLQHKFSITSYRLISVERFEEVISWLQQQIAFKVRPKLRRSSNTVWRNEHFSSIWARTKEMGLEKQDVYNLVSQKLGKSVTSLTELGERDLKKLYNIIMKL